MNITERTGTYKGNDYGDKHIIRKGIDWGDIGEKFRDIINKIIKAAKYIFSEEGGACDDSNKEDVLDKWEEINKKIIENEKQIPDSGPDNNIPENKDDDDEMMIIKEIPDSPDDTNPLPNKNNYYPYYNDSPYSSRDNKKIRVDVEYDWNGLNREKKNRQNKDIYNPYTDYDYRYNPMQNWDCPYSNRGRYPRNTKVCKNDKKGADKKKLKFKNHKLRMKKNKLRKLKEKNPTAKKLKMKTGK